MKFLADESVDFPIVKALRENSFDIDYIAESSAGIPDEDVLEKANKSERILLTADKDFGDLTYRLKKLSKGIILYRLSGLSNAAKSKLILDIFLKYQNKFENSFTLISKSFLRIKLLK